MFLGQDILYGGGGLGGKRCNVPKQEKVINIASFQKDAMLITFLLKNHLSNCPKKDKNMA